MRFKLFVVISMSILSMVACDSKQRVKAPEAGQPAATPQTGTENGHVVEVKEAIHANTYTYLYVSEGDKEYWIATAKQPLDVGMILGYDTGLEMKDFTSKEVDRTFESIWFVGKMRGASSAMTQMGTGKNPVAKVNNVTVSKAEGGLSVKDLYSDMTGYEGKIVTIRGKVTKFNSGIMGKNWVHLQDGTSAGDYFDVTLTTDAMVKVGDVLVFSGKVSLNKDFGAGYKYDLILEEAQVSAES